VNGGLGESRGLFHSYKKGARQSIAPLWGNISKRRKHFDTVYFYFPWKKVPSSSWDRPAFAGLALRLLHSLAMTDHLVIARNEVTKQSFFSSRDRLIACSSR